MSTLVNLTSRRFGRLLVLYRTGSDRHKKAMWRCQCDCGNEIVVVGSNIQTGNTASCGCLKREINALNKPPPPRPIANLLGNKYNRLLVVGNAERTKSNKVAWLCECDCGNKTVVPSCHLISGHTQSCGCYHDGFLYLKNVKYDRADEKNPNWKGGITSKNRRCRSTAKFLKWRKTVIERDNYTCQRCRLKGANSNAHHVYGFAEHELHRYKIENGITLCKECHNEFHKQYGYKEFGESKLTLYLNAT